MDGRSGMASSLSCQYTSHIGLNRDGNEDAGLISSSLIAVADGMGGHAGGEVASSIAINVLATLSSTLRSADLDSDSREDLLLNSIYDIDNELLAATAENDALSGMGTTLTALYLTEGAVQVLHVGDSRCYSWDAKKKVLRQISVDHTVMQELIDQGRLTHAEAQDHPQRSLLTQALVGDSGVDPLLQVVPASAGDKFLLCSDGLSSTLSDAEMNKIITSHKDEEVVGALLNATLDAGAPDNVTIIWATVVDGEPSVGTTLLGAAHE